MGFLAKFSTKPSQKLAAAGPGGTKVSAGAASMAAYGRAKTGVDIGAALADPDDEATIYTTFMVIFYGFFGLTLLFYPYIHAASYNPMAYWTSMTDQLAFSFRIAGSTMLAIVLGPFLDEIFGGPGVVMKVFSRQTLIMNTCGFVIFIYYTFYAPLSNAVPLMWQAQTYLFAIMLAWSIIEVAGTGLSSYYMLFCTYFFGFFAVGLCAAPATMFGPGFSPTVYWNTWTDLGIMTGRGLGIGLMCEVVCAYVLYGGYVYGASLVKMYTVFNLANLALFISPAYLGGNSSVDTMWQMQVCMQIPIVIVGLYLELSDATGPWKPALSLPAKCGLNAETYNFVNVIWYLPFVIGFYVDPNMLFGPKAITGMPMFTMALDETGLWFGRAWATAMLMIVAGPYLFGFPHVKVTKQLTLSYLLFIGLFAYCIVNTSIMNITVIGPMTGINFLFFCAGLYCILPGQSGEAML